MYSVHRLQPRKKIGPARTIDHALLMAEADGHGRYEVSIIGDVSKHVCFLTKHENGTFTVDPRQAGSFTVVLSDTLTRA